MPANLRQKYASCRLTGGEDIGGKGGSRNRLSKSPMMTTTTIMTMMMLQDIRHLLTNAGHHHATPLTGMNAGNDASIVSIVSIETIETAETSGKLENIRKTENPASIGMSPEKNVGVTKALRSMSPTPHLVASNHPRNIMRRKPSI